MVLIKTGLLGSVCARDASESVGLRKAFGTRTVKMLPKKFPKVPPESALVVGGPDAAGMGGGACNGFHPPVAGNVLLDERWSS